MWRLSEKKAWVKETASGEGQTCEDNGRMDVSAAVKVQDGPSIDGQRFFKKLGGLLRLLTAVLS